MGGIPVVGPWIEVGLRKLGVRRGGSELPV